MLHELMFMAHYCLSYRLSPSAEALLKHKFFKNSDRNKEIMMEEMVSKTEGVDVDAVESGPKPTILPDGTVVQPIGKGAPPSTAAQTSS